MAKKLQLQIPTPCHENWENMTHSERGRFCNSCQKQVIDFSNKSDGEIAMFFKKPSTTSVCGRFMEDQLNRDMDIPRKRIPWLKYFFQFLIPAFFISYRATAQGKVKAVPNETSQLSNNWQNKSSKGKLATEVCMRTIGDTVGFTLPEPVSSISGKVIDHSRNPIPYATVAIKGTKIAVAADSTGRFTIDPKPAWKHVTLFISCVGFAPLEKNIGRSDNKNDQEIELQQAGTLREVLVKSFDSRRVKGMVGSVIHSTYSFAVNDTLKLKSNFRIYPNPSKANSTLTIELNQNQNGDHLLQLFNQSGQLIFSKDIFIDEKARSFTMNMPSIISGNYFLKLTGRATGKSYAEKLIVE